MKSKTSVLRLHNSLKSSALKSHMWIPVKHVSSRGFRPKMTIYHEDLKLDEVMELRKMPVLIFRLKSIIQSQKTRSLLLRDLQKEVGFLLKWDYMAVIERYPSIFSVGGGYKMPPYVKLTERAEKIAEEESEAMKSMEPILVTNLRKLLMLSVDSKIPLETIKLIESEMGLPWNFEASLIPKYPEFFLMKEEDGKAFVHLASWDPSLAVTAREAKLAKRRINSMKRYPQSVRISKDGNYPGPHSFDIRFHANFRTNACSLKEYEEWQKMEFPSPYMNAKRLDIFDRRVRKRAVGVLHEFLSLTMEKRLTSDKVEAFHSEFYLPSKLILFLIKHHGIFYITNKGERSSVFLKEAYDGSRLIEKCPILKFNAKFLSLTGSRVRNFN